jgi:hypothetical protein
VRLMGYPDRALHLLLTSQVSRMSHEPSERSSSCSERSSSCSERSSSCSERSSSCSLLQTSTPDTTGDTAQSARDSTQRTGKEGRRLRSALHLCVARQSCNSLSSHYLSSYLAFLSRSLITCCQAVGQRAESVLTLPQVLLHINDEVLDSKCTCHAYHTHAHT